MTKAYRHTAGVPRMLINDDGTLTAAPTGILPKPSGVNAGAWPMFAPVDPAQYNPLYDYKNGNMNSGITFSVGGQPQGKNQAGEGVQ